MIIWSGFGILIPVIAIAGMFVGIMLGTLVDQPVIGASIGMLIAATGNRAIWKAIYPKEPRVLIDQATGQRVVVNPRHSLFFHPGQGMDLDLRDSRHPGSDRRPYGNGI